MKTDALPLAQVLHVVQVRLRYRAAANDCQACRAWPGQGVNGYGRGGGGASRGQLAGITQHQGLAGLHRHQQRPGGDQWTAVLAHDVGRGFHPVYTVFGQHPEVVDEVTRALRERHQLLSRLHGLAGGQVTEQLAQDLRHVDAIKQFAGLGFGDHKREAGHAEAPWCCK
ncbi:hypothetical protein D3C78_1154770 [compost metagenome]